MSHSASSTPSLTPSRSASPEAPVQPDHFYGNDNASAVSSPHGKPWLDPADDPLAQRGIPVFKPTMVEFQDFERYMNRIECWGMRSGIVKVIPPKEWTDALPSVIPQLGDVKLKSPIEQHMIGHGGLFRQQNIEKRKIFSVREWAEMCATDDLRAPGKDEIELRSGAGAPAKRKPRRVPKKAKDGVVDEQGLAGVVMVKDEPEVDDGVHVAMDVDEGITATILTADASDNNHAHQPSSTQVPVDENNADAEQLQGAEGGSSRKKGRAKQTGATKEAQLAERAAKDATFLQDFKPLDDWLPPKTTNADYTPDFCKELERRYWRNCGLGKAPWYGADLLGSLFTDDTKAWNVAHLPSTLSRLLPASSKGLPGVNTPYLYFGMWRATFAWHVEDMDLFSINYIHFGAPKFWYAMPQARSGALEQTMKGYFPRDIMECPQFLRHKSFLASPTVLGQSSCRPNTLVQRQGEFVITYPKGYHAGFNLGFNCAESVNFALDSWLDLGRKAKICTCVNYSVRIDVDQLLADREAERLEAEVKPKAEIELLDASNGRKRKAGDAEEIEETNVEQSEQPSKKLKIRISKPVSNEGADVATPAAVPVGTAFPSKPKVLLKLGPQPKAPEVEAFPCCLCVSTRRDGLLRVINPPFGRKEGASGSGKSEPWMAHEECASVVPETWVDEIDIGVNPHTGALVRERVVLGVDAIVKDRWNLKCSACSKTRQKAHGAPVQCTKGRCPRAFHVSCARDGAATNIVYNVLGFTEKEVISVDQAPPANGIPAQYHQTAQPPPPMASLQPPVPMPGQQSFHAPTPQLTAGPSHIEPNPSAQYQSQSPVKVVRKLEVSVLCPQHNPAISDAKKAQKQDKIKAALLALPPMARIKLRVSAGVFEVTLVSVMEETGCVEVLWDRGLKREFRWGSVVFGKTEDVVGHKPAEPATGPDANREFIEEGIWDC
ncbi:JmjC-domain-containing protein [Cristinia sonorae]|uniref:[histone H3]-trimethyl-L-lysine(9) demethylase n=1 Tax=Cristinia sonorae TaxID=1940300 RepID=A0A8K0XTC8_9AGAR|nr:JmjC-domain-containing protein [Cristinia sonorae]